MLPFQPRNGAKRHLIAWALGASLLSIAVSCSLLVENKTEQCQGDAECGAGFRCSENICVKAAGSGGSGGTGSTTTSSASSSSSSSSSSGATCDVDGGIQGGGCFGCDPATNAELLNRCSDAECFPFDNQKRVEALMNGGKLPPLPTPDGG